MASPEQLIRVGEIRGFYGIKGWVKLFSWTQPRENLLRYAHFDDGQGKALNMLEARVQGKGLVAHFEGCDSRDDAQQLQGVSLHVPRASLPPTEEDEYYWSDLIGATVVDRHAGVLGAVDHLIETGSNDVLVVRSAAGREQLLPFVVGDVIVAVDVEGKRIDVDWPGIDNAGQE